MNHIILVGHFNETTRDYSPGVARPIEIGVAREVAQRHFDRRDNGSCMVACESALPLDGANAWFGRVGGADVYLSNGYLECPWIINGINAKAVAFSLELQEKADCQIWQPDDCRFYEREDCEAATNASI